MSRHVAKPFAKKSLGQNFLVDQRYISRIVEAVGPSEGDVIVEIGPGRGALTERLVESDAQVVAIELDTDLARRLSERFSEQANFSVIEADAVRTDIRRLLEGQRAEPGPSRKAKVVANLPYYISTAILQPLADQRTLFSSLVLMFQKEVVDRITAGPGNSDRGFLTVVVEASFTIEKLFDVPPQAFRPVPKVTSSVVRLTPKGETLGDPLAFRELVSKGFAQKRKTILNNLRQPFPKAVAALKTAEIDPTRRAESISLDEWLRLFAALE